MWHIFYKIVDDVGEVGVVVAYKIEENLTSIPFHRAFLTCSLPESIHFPLLWLPLFQLPLFGFLEYLQMYRGKITLMQNTCFESTCMIYLNKYNSVLIENPYLHLLGKIFILFIHVKKGLDFKNFLYVIMSACSHLQFAWCILNIYWNWDANRKNFCIFKESVYLRTYQTLGFI